MYLYLKSGGLESTLILVGLQLKDLEWTEGD